MERKFRDLLYSNFFTLTVSFIQFFLYYIRNLGLFYPIIVYKL